MKKSGAFGAAEGIDDGFVTESVFAALHDESEPGVDALMGLLRLLRRHHFRFQPLSL